MTRLMLENDRRDFTMTDEGLAKPLREPRDETPLGQVDFESIFAGAPIGIFRSTTKQLLIVNPALARMFGYNNPAEMVASTDDSRDFFVQPEQRAEIVRAALAGNTYARREVQYRRKDGSSFLAQLCMRATGGCPGGIFLEGFVEDISERRQLEEEFRHVQKMEAIGQLAGGVAHDFNNILAATLLQLSFLQEDLHLPLETRESLKEIEAETRRAVNLTRQLLLFGRRQVARPEPLEVNASIAELLKMLRRLLGENIQIHFLPDAACTLVKADAGMLEQVVMNLCVNARDAMPRGGQLTIRTAGVALDEEQASRHARARPGRFVRLTVEDNGCGMDQAVLKRLFEPFFTTKAVGKGTGLGLATVYGIVKQHEGWIEVESKPGHGSRFHVYFPALAPAAPAVAANERRESVRGGTETILLVEDDFSLRRTTGLCLRKLGYAVLEAANGKEAMDIWQKQQSRIRLLFTDMVMPQTTTGLDLAARLRRDQPHLQVIITSGYSAEQGSLTSTGTGIAFLAKPYQHVDLAKLVRRCLDQVGDFACPCRQTAIAT